MTTHYHAVIDGTCAEPVAGLQWFHSRYARAFNRRYGPLRPRLRRAIPVPDGRRGRRLRPLRLCPGEPRERRPLRPDRPLAVVVQPLWSRRRLRPTRPCLANLEPHHLRPPNYSVAKSSSKCSRSSGSAIASPAARARSRHSVAPERVTRSAKRHAPAPRTRTPDPSPRSRPTRTPRDIAERGRARARPAKDAVHPRDQPLPSRDVLGTALRRLSPRVPGRVCHVQHPVVVLAGLDQLPDPVEECDAALPLLRPRLGGAHVTPRPAPTPRAP